MKRWIIGILASLLLPALSRGKASARRATCAQTEHQMGLALAMYVDDTGKYPPTTLEHRGGGPGWIKYWQDYIQPYARGDAGRSEGYANGVFVFLCAERGKDHARGIYGYNSYGVNINPKPADPQDQLGLGGTCLLPLSPSDPPSISESTISVPTDMIAIGDVLFETDYALTICPVPMAAIDNAFFPARRHSGGANFLFCDAHVDYAKQKVWLSGLDQNLMKWNNDHRPHRELINTKGLPP